MKSPSIPLVAANSEDVKVSLTDNMISPEELSKLSIAFNQATDSPLSSSVIQKVLDYLPAMIGYWDKSLKNRFVNKSYGLWFGVDASQIVGKYIWELLGEDLYRLNLPYIQGALKGEFQAFERIIPNVDGSSSRHSLTHYIPDVRDDGEVQGFFVLVTDVSAIKEAEAVLRKSEERFRSVVQDQTEVISRSRADGTYLFVNDVYCRFFGKTEQETIGSTWKPVVYPEDMQRVVDELATMSQANPVVTIENRVLSASGDIHWMQFSHRGIFDDHGQLTEIQSVGRDVSDRKRAEEEIQNLAYKDALTGLFNRRHLLDRLHIALAASARSMQYGALLFLDLDKFKVINDTQGHSDGDMLLIEVAKRINACVREVDTVARQGGDEFVVLVERLGTNLEDASRMAAKIAENIRVALAEPYQINQMNIHSSSSIGVSVFCGHDNSVEELIKRADMAMYQAKDGGRNRVRFFDPEMQKLVEVRALLESDLHVALKTEQFELHYQLQVDHENQPIGAEALIRWVHPQRGMISPAHFIPVAEESTLILSIGDWVLDEACRQIAVWSTHEKMRNLVLAVNISAQQFKQAHFVEQIVSAIRKHGIDPTRLKLELTESVALDDIADVIAKKNLLRQEVGVTLSLDDFGTGFSSLSYLKRLPLDQIKIDQSFVRDITTDKSDAVMVKTIIDMAQNFSLNVIAEGVETEAQLAFLKQHDCMAYQGYLFSKPLPIEQFDALMKHYGSATDITKLV
ncbi:MAG: EAL domain-containing protein [Methylotenera sp.]|nr:EAL domain-containing protein [Methylotenera sp.]